MIGIIITQQIINQNNHAWLNGKTVGTIVTLPNYPNNFWVTKKYDCAYQYKTEVHHDDGWRDVIQPSYNSQTQNRGDIYFDEENDVFTYQVVDKSPEEIQNQLTAEAEATKQQLIQQQVEKQLLSSAQEMSDGDALENQALFPLWQVKEYYNIGFKMQAFTENNELALYRCIVPHESSELFHPKNDLTKFIRIE